MAIALRVLSVFTGRTASPMQAVSYPANGKARQPERLLQPKDVAVG